VRADLHRRAPARPAGLSARHRVGARCDGGYRRTAAEWTRRIADNAPLTIAAAKSAIRAHVSDDPAGLAEAGRLYAAADASADYAEGRRAFTEKRAPRFTGN